MRVLVIIFPSFFVFYIVIKLKFVNLRPFPKCHETLVTSMRASCDCARKHYLASGRI